MPRSGNLMGRQSVQGLSVELDGAARRSQQTGDQVKHGSLPGTIGTDQAEDAALGNRQANVPQHLQAAEILCDR